MCSHNSGGKVNGRARPAWWAPILFAAAVLQPVRCDVKTAAEQWTAAFPGQVALANFSVMYNAAFAGMYTPVAELVVLSDADVVKALTIVAQNNATTAVSAGRHSYVAQSIGNTLVLSVRNLTAMRLVGAMADGTVGVAVGAGVRLLELYTFLAQQTPSLAVPGGSCPSVGVSGLTSGGGHGTTSALLGLTADVVYAADVVMQDPLTRRYIAVHANTTNEYADVLAALRGGMGGNYGVVTAWYLRATPIDDVVLFSFRARIAGDSLADVTAKAVAFMSFIRAPKLMDGSALPAGRLWSNVKVMPQELRFFGQCVCDAAGTADAKAATVKSKASAARVRTANDCDSCHSALQYLHANVLATPSCDADDDSGWLSACSTVQQSFGMAMWSTAGCTAWGGDDFFPPEGLKAATPTEISTAIAQCLAYDHAMEGGPYLGRSLYMPSEDALDRGFFEAALAAVGACATTRCLLVLDYYGDAMLREPSGCSLSGSPLRCTSFDHRTPSWHMQVLAFWSDASQATAAAAWSQQTMSTLQPMSLGTSYQNYPDASLSPAVWPTMYFTNATYATLQQTKCRYNPANVFAVPHAAGSMVAMPVGCVAANAGKESPTPRRLR